MQAVAKLKHLRMAPRKVRLVADLIRGKKTDIAQNILNFSANRSSKVILKLLDQAISNAKNNLKSSATNFYISKITVDEGPTLKRFRPRARGSAYEIQKRTSHITIILNETKEMKKKRVEKDKLSDLSDKEELKQKKIKQPSAVKFGQDKEFSKPKAQGIKQKVFRRQVF